MQTRHPLTCFDWAVLCSFSKITWGEQISTRSVGSNVPRGESGLGHISRHRGRLLDPSTANTRDRSTSRSKDRSAIYTMHFDILDGTMLAWLNRELAVPTAGRPLLGCEGGPIVHSFILRGVSGRGTVGAAGPRLPGLLFHRASNPRTEMLPLPPVFHLLHRATLVVPNEYIYDRTL